MFLATTLMSYALFADDLSSLLRKKEAPQMSSQKTAIDSLVSPAQPTTTNNPPATSPTTNSTGATEAASNSAEGAAGAELNSNIVSAVPEAPIVQKLPAACKQLESEFSNNLKSTCGTVVAAATACGKTYATSAKICNTETNPNLLSTMTQIQGIMSGVQGAGLTDSCGTFSKIMNLGKLGMAAYTTFCGVQQKLCDVGCSKSLNAIQNFEEMVTTGLEMLQACANEPHPSEGGKCVNDVGVINTQIIPILKNEQAPKNTTIAHKTKVCKVDMLSLMGMGALNIASLAQAKGVSDKCEKETAAAEAAKAPETSLVDCARAENSDKPICICKANPRMKGCEGVPTSAVTHSALNSSNGTGLASNRNPGSLTAAPGAATDATAAFPKTSSGNGQDGVGGPGGGSSAGLGASSGSANSAENTTGQAASKDSANILDSSGGGGGGGFRGGGFGSYTSPQYRAKLKAFANRNGIGAKIAGRSWTDQVTATGGKSNFEKIKARYQENKASLLSK